MPIAKAATAVATPAASPGLFRGVCHGPPSAESIRAVVSPIDGTRRIYTPVDLSRVRLASKRFPVTGYTH